MLNRFVHIIYMGLMLSIFFIAYKYLATIIEEELGKIIDKKGLSTIPMIITILGVIFLPLSYIETPVSNYSYGPAAFMTYIGVAIYVILILRLMKLYGKEIPRKKERAMFIALVSEIPVAIYQILIPESLITCLGIVLLNMGLYLTTENPDAHLAEQLEKERQRADAANKAKTNFLANMSHEIRTPINAVLGMNEMILRETKEPNTREYAQDVQGSAKSLLSIINDILDISKIEAGKLSVITAEYDFSSVMHDVINMISFKAKMKELEFKVVIDETIPAKLLGDDIRLRQILVNLLNNAVKYTEKGTVTLEIKNEPSKREDAARIQFCVKDTGIGIKEEDLQKLCTPFERLEEQRNRNIEGTGLGMSIVKQLLSLLQSELKVASEYGKESEFSFELIQEIADPAPIGRLGERIESTSKEMHYRTAFVAPEARILVVDDNDMNRRVFVSLLKSTKIQIDEAASGKACLERIKETRYDIIFLDHMMPELDGVETFRIMKQMKEFPSKDAPVVILTANAVVGAKEMYLEEGFKAFLAKPIDYRKLENLIVELLDKELIQSAENVAAEKEESENTVTDTIAEDNVSKEPDSVMTKELPMIDGLDWKYAVTHFPDEQGMLDTVKFFVSMIEYDAQELEKFFVNIHMDSGRKNYCTKVHSMKNSAATVGIIPLAGMAKVLEDAARENQPDVLEMMTPLFLERWRAYKKKTEPLFLGEDNVSDEPGGYMETEAGEASGKEAGACKEEILKILEQIQVAAEEMDIDALDALWCRLEEYSFEGHQKEALEKIHIAILNFNVEFLQVGANVALF